MKHLLTTLYDAYVRDLGLIVRHYLPLGFARREVPRMVFRADGRFPHGGMFDRLKGIISVYAASKCIGREFKILFNHPFNLSDYLAPNRYDWTVAPDELQNHWPAARPVFMYGEGGNPTRLVRRSMFERHYYYGFDSLQWLNNRYGQQFDFGQLYAELFHPTDYLQAYIDQYKAEIGAPYVAIHFRFMNLIGDSNEFADINPTLPAEQQKRLVEESLRQVEFLMAQHPDHRVMLATDSPQFTALATERFTVLYVAPGEIKHIGTASDTTADSNLKMFLDYYLISEADYVYNLVSGEMWKSAFPEYAAKIGQKPFQRIFY
ncbi:MAG: hypothetical protein HUK09_05100 [Bacteroidaceae bacterium]|nr:hypothetical protein [Bacteroidaceae bacterium]